MFFWLYILLISSCWMYNIYVGVCHKLFSRLDGNQIGFNLWSGTTGISCAAAKKNTSDRETFLNIIQPVSVSKYHELFHLYSLKSHLSMHTAVAITTPFRCVMESTRDESAGRAFRFVFRSWPNSVTWSTSKYQALSFRFHPVLD